MVDVGAIAKQFAFCALQARTNKTLCWIPVKLSVGDSHFAPVNGLKGPELRLALSAFAILVFEFLEPINGVLRQVLEVVLDLLNVPFQRSNALVGLEAVELRYALDADFCEACHILVRHFTQQMLDVRFQAFVNGRENLLPRFAFLDVAVNAVLNEDFFKRSEVPRLLEFSKLNFELALEQVACAVGTDPEDVRDAHEDWLVFEDNAAVGRQTHFAICERIKRIQHLVRRDVVGQVHHHFDLIGGVVLNLLDFDLSLVVGFENAVNQRSRGHAVRNLPNHQRLAVHLVDARTHSHAIAAETVVVILHVRHPACREVRVELEAFVLIVGNASVDQLDEVVRKDFAGQTHGNPIHPTRQQQRKLHRKRFRLFVPAIVGRQPRRRLCVEEHLEGKLAELDLDVTGCRRTVASKDVSPVSLAVEEQFALTNLNHGIPNARISVRMVLHRVADDVGDLVETAVVHLAQAMQDPALHGLQPVVLVRDGAL